MLFCKMFVVFYSVKFSIWVLMTFSSSSCLGDAITMHGIYAYIYTCMYVCMAYYDTVIVLV